MWHFIGHLQTNKVKLVVPYASLIQSVDSERLLAEIDKAARAAGKVMDCLLEVHIAEEATKQGNNLLMLYKNLPENELNKVMRVRFWLDGLAALMFLLKFHWGDFKAVFRAHREFRHLKAEFVDSREENLQEASITQIPERVNFSLLWRYHIKRQKTYTQLTQ